MTSFPAPLVLIETLWNVNLILYDDRTLAISINRNIVECKFPCFSVNIVGLFRINRNIVECKYEYILPQNLQKVVLIETLWNVNTAT